MKDSEVVARPFVKWAGGKGRLLHALRVEVPASFGHYYEPFLGGGALFFALQPGRGTLSDSNAELINAYRIVRDDVEPLIACLREHRYEKTHYLDVRAQNPELLTCVQRAGRFIFLMKTCFNGLYRVNGKGQFNVPFGKFASDPTICDASNLRACSLALREVKLHCKPFEYVAEDATPGSFVYFDPPYLPVSETSYFTGYTKVGFGFDDHRRLRDVARDLKDRGVRVLLSHSAADGIRSLYSSSYGFCIKEVSVHRSIGPRAAHRGSVTEFLIR